MEENKKNIDLRDVKHTVQKMINLNELFLDSVKFNQCECYEKFRVKQVIMDFNRIF